MEIIKNNYPTHKTISLIDEKPIANTIAERPIIDSALRAEVSSVIKPIVDSKPIISNVYPSHKTTVLSDTTVEGVKDVLKKDIVEPVKDILKKEEDVKKVLSTEIVNPIKDELKKEIESVKSVIPSTPEIKVDATLLVPKNQEVIADSVKKELIKTLSKENYPAHKTVSLEIIEPVKDVLKKGEDIGKLLTTEIVNPVKDELKKDIESVKSVISSVPEIKKDATLLVSENQGVITDSVKKELVKTLSKENYPAHKTVTLETLLGVEQKVELNIPEPLVTKPNTPEELKPPASKPVEPILNTATDINSKNTYPAHKTFSFVASDNKVVDNQVIAPSVQTAVKTENKPNVVVPVTKNEPIASKESAVPAKAKKPLVWIIASATILVTSVATIWYVNNEKNKLQDEVVALKQSNVELSENLLRLQKDIRIDDIIARAGIVDAKNNIAVEQDATKSSVIRTCFSVMPNGNAKQGTKTVYIRLLDGAGNIITANKNNTFDYKGEKIEYSEKKEIDFKGNDLMLCADYKPTQKLEKGTYKAELYSDGVLDGTATFELK